MLVQLSEFVNCQVTVQLDTGQVLTGTLVVHTVLHGPKDSTITLYTFNSGTVLHWTRTGRCMRTAAPSTVSKGCGDIVTITTC